MVRRRGSTLGLVRASIAKKRDGATGGFIVTWDVNRRDIVANGRVRRFVFGQTTRSGNGARREYRYPGFVHRDGVYYLGQSVLFVEFPRLGELLRFLEHQGVPHEIRAASLM